MIDIESLEEIKSDEYDCPICLNQFSKNVEDTESKIECSSKRHDVCNVCMTRWIRESIERRQDVKCVICNEIIYQFQVHQQRVQNQMNIHSNTKDILERNIREISISLNKLCCFSSIGFGIIFLFYLVLPTNKYKYLINFMIFYITIVFIISLGLYLNRLYYIYKLDQMNRIHPEITFNQMDPI